MYSINTNQSVIIGILTWLMFTLGKRLNLHPNIGISLTTQVIFPLNASTKIPSACNKIVKQAPGD
jgi:hypothetical protein